MSSRDRPPEEPPPTLAQPTIQPVAPAGSSDTWHPAPEKLGRYAITGKLGAGGMGEVLSVRDEDLGREVAAKLTPTSADQHILQKFVMEAQITGQLEHPNIVPVHELSMTSEGCAFFTMKRIEGKDLDAIITRDRRLSPGAARRRLAERLQVFLKVCDAIEFAHSRGVIHRDLKPANIMVGAFGEVLVCDWGLAKALGQEEAQTGGKSPSTTALKLGTGTVASMAGDPMRTVDGVVMGTPAYMPPEQAEGRIDDLDERSDVYALGAILYEMLALVPPFSGRDVYRILESVAIGAVEPPSARSPEAEVPWELEAVVMKAMATKPSARYQSVADLRSDIGAFLTHGMLAAARYSAVQRLGKWVRMNRYRLLAGTAVLAVLLLAGVAGRHAYVTKQDREEFETHRLAADAAFEGGRWDEAELAAQRALDLFPDEKLSNLIAETRKRKSAAEADRKKQVARMAAYQKLQEKLRPLAARIAGARTYFYVPDIDIQARLAGVREARDEIQKMARSPQLREHAAVWQMLGQALFVLGEEGPAELAFLEAVRLDPKVAGAARGLGMIYARRSLSALISHSHGNRDRMGVKSKSWARKAHAWLVRAQGEAAIDSLEAEVLAIYRLLAENEKEGARRAAQRALSTYGRVLGSEELLIVVGITVDGDQSKNYFDQAIARCPNHAWALFLRSTRQAERADQLADLDRAIRINPSFVFAYVNRGAIRARTEDKDGALSDLDKALGLDPRNTLALYNRGLLKLGKGWHDAAIADASRAYEIDGTYIDALELRAKARADKGDVAGSKADYEEVLRLDPESPKTYHDRGASKARRGDLDGAIEDFTRAINLDNTYALAYANRGTMYEQTGKLDKALTDLNRAVALDPTILVSYRFRVRVHQQNGDLTKMIADLSVLIRNKVGADVPYIFRGVARALNGDRDGGIADIEEAIRINSAGVYGPLWLTCLDGQKDRLTGLATRTDPIAPVAQFILGRITRLQLIEAVEKRVKPGGATRTNLRCQALGLAGAWAERLGRVDEAKAAYRDALKTGIKSSLQHTWSRFRLQQLK